MLDQSPSAGTRLAPGEFVTVFVGKFEAPTTTTTPTTTTPTTTTPAALMRVAVLSGGRSSEHEVSLRVRRLGLGRAARGRPRGGPDPDRAGRPMVRRRQRDRAARGGWAARCRRGLPCPARAVRRGRHGAGNARVPRRALRRGRACSPRRWRSTSWSSSACSPSTASRRWTSARPASEGWREHVAAMGLPLWVKPARLGSSVGISKVTNTGARAGRGGRRWPAATTHG